MACQPTSGLKYICSQIEVKYHTAKLEMTRGQPDESYMRCWYISAAAQIPHDPGLSPMPHMVEKFYPTGD